MLSAMRRELLVGGGEEKKGAKVSFSTLGRPTQQVTRKAPTLLEARLDRKELRGREMSETGSSEGRRVGQEKRGPAC